MGDADGAQTVIAALEHRVETLEAEIADLRGRCRAVARGLGAALAQVQEAQRAGATDSLAAAAIAGAVAALDELAGA